MTSQFNGQSIKIIVFERGEKESKEFDSVLQELQQLLFQKMYIVAFENTLQAPDIRAQIQKGSHNQRL